MEEKLEKEEMKREIWDCGSSLYDSFELKSLQHQIHSSILLSSTGGRTMSMPHLSHHRQPPLHHHQPPKKHHSRSISKSLHKLLRSVFRPKQTHHNNYNYNNNLTSDFYVYDTSTTLSTIPELPETLPEFDGISPEIKSLVRRTQSDRFLSTSLGISCV
ncbi:hypothetical protein L6452_31642 [Arctium lappa]|uniref:Uncharacterized protein n=1 Tax=Arctium lappa TaxID=4217 RepID=A0ACB8Z6K6_ARCLA|nr:hypothetical protein L6452_31642 [Arctium lappa]